MVHYVPEYHDVPLYIEMPPAKDIIKKNVREIYINPKDYIKEISESDSSEEITCSGCPTLTCYYCDTNSASHYAQNDISRLFDF